MDRESAILIIVGFAAGAALTTLAGLWIALAVKRQAERDLQAILLERQVEQLPAMSELRQVWDRDKASAQAEAEAPLEVLTREEEAHLKALAEGIANGPREARRRQVIEADKIAADGERLEERRNGDR